MLAWLAASALAAPFDFSCSPDEGAGVVGVPPLEIRCVVEPPPGTFDRAVFAWGDGQTEEGTALAHVYDAPDQYSVAVTLFGYAPPAGGETGLPAPEAGDLSVRRDGLVTVCGPPEPEFSWVDMGGLDVRLVNSTPVAVGCIEEIRWEVFRGTRTDGDPELTFDGWEPRFLLPEEGEWTVVLTLGGIAGTRAAELAIDARYGLPDGLFSPRARCASVPGGLAAPGLLLIGLLTRRRRR